MLITYPLMTVVDDSGAVVSGATVAITSVKDKAGADIATPGATVNQSGANLSVDYDAETRGEAWVVLAISKVGSTFTGLNAAPAFYLAKDSGRVLGSIPNAAPGAAGGLPALDGSAHMNVFSVSQAVTLPAIPANWITSSGVAAGALNGRGDWLVQLGVNAPAGWINASAIAVGALAGKGDWNATTPPTAVAIASAVSAAILATPGTPLANDDSGRVILQPSGLDAIQIEVGVNARQSLSPILAAAAGVLSGPVPGTAGTVVGKNPAGTATRLTTVVDTSGYRTSTTLNLPA